LHAVNCWCIEKGLEVDKSTAHEEAQDRFGDIRKKLVVMRQDLMREAKTEIGQILNEGDKYNGASDDGDLADVAVRDEIQGAKSARHRSRLRDIDEALRRIEEGTYGICSECEEEIPVRRLNVVPFALLCVACQEKLELMSSLRDDSMMLPESGPEEQDED
jgi:DnaK suppressor protein